MTIEALDSIAPGGAFHSSRAGVRNPGAIRTAPPTLGRAAGSIRAQRLATYAETLSLACVIAAVAGLLPLVMMMHR